MGWKKNRKCSLKHGQWTSRRLGLIEYLEPRLTLSASSIDGRAFVDIGPSDNVAWDQPRITLQFLTEDFPAGTDPDSSIIVGPNTFNSWLLDTGANTTLAFKTAVEDMKQFEPRYQTFGQFEELGVGGVELFDVSLPYRFDFSGSTNFERNTLLDKRIISNEERDLSIFGPWGIVGMPAMTERVTTLDFTPWTDVQGFNLFMNTDFYDELPEPVGPRFTLEVDNRVNFSPDGSAVPPGGPVPAWADLPFFGAELLNNESRSSGNFLFDTGAQVSIINSRMAFDLGLDSNGDGVLNARDANFARTETIGGIAGTTEVPVFIIDEVHLPSKQGPDLVWTDLQWIILDIVDGIDGVFGFDNMTSGWIEAFAVDGQSGYTLQSHLDFRGWSTTGKGEIHFDFNEEYFTLIDPSGPGAVVTESGDSTVVTENSVATDSYEIRLTEPPTADVTINLVGGNGQVEAVDAANPSNNFLIFTPQNWSVPQTVLVRGVDDSIQEGFQRAFVRNLSSSSDPNYDGVGMPRISVGVVDDDFAGMMILPTDGDTTVTEGGAPDFYDVVLMTPPLQDVFIIMEHVANQIELVGEDSGTTVLTFTPDNWNVPQRVRVTAVDDDLEESLLPAYISHVIATADESYSQAFGLQERAFVRDNDGSDQVGPRVTDVIVASSSWSDAFIDLIDGGGTNAGNGLGYSLVGDQQLRNLPWSQLDKLYVQFDEDVSADFKASNVGLFGVNVADYAPALAFGVDGVNVGTISLSAPLTSDILSLRIADTLQDASGNALDGEWSDSNSLTSGDGSNGGDFRFRIDVLPGDVNDSNAVSITDVFLTLGSSGQLTSLELSKFDINGSGAINITDVFAVLGLSGTVLPPPGDSLLPPSNDNGKGDNGNGDNGGDQGGGYGGGSLAVLLEGYGGLTQATNLDFDLPADVTRYNPFLARAMQRARQLSHQQNQTEQEAFQSTDIVPGAAVSQAEKTPQDLAFPTVEIQPIALASVQQRTRDAAILQLVEGVESQLVDSSRAQAAQILVHEAQPSRGQFADSLPIPAGDKNRSPDGKQPSSPWVKLEPLKIRTSL
ncbi:MAG: hypothetical protein NXI32_26900 [bacterium]|nr:hypothetical protein [bacterium]